MEVSHPGVGLRPKGNIIAGDDALKIHYEAGPNAK